MKTKRIGQFHLPVAAGAAHGGQNGIGYLGIVFFSFAHGPNPVGVQFDQVLKSLLVPGVKHKKPQYEYQNRGDDGHVNIVGRIWDDRTQQAVRIARVQQRIHRHQPDQNHQDINRV